MTRAQRVQKVNKYKIRNIRNDIIVSVYDNIATKGDNNKQPIVWVS